MKKFMAVYLGSGEKMKNWKPDEATMKKGMEAWSKWATDNANVIVDQARKGLSTSKTQ